MIFFVNVLCFVSPSTVTKPIKPLFPIKHTSRLKQNKNTLRDHKRSFVSAFTPHPPPVTTSPSNKRN